MNKKFLKSFYKSEKGAITVLVAVAFTVLVGFVAIVVDYGSLLNEKSILQNAVDAAALAGVVESSDEDKDIEMAIDYVLKNVENLDETNITVVRTGNQLKVSAYKDCEAYFSQVVTGRLSNRVSATATAQYGPETRTPYAIWAEDEIDIDAGATQVAGVGIQGSIHSNSARFTLPMWFFTEITGETTYAVEDMPDYSYLLEDLEDDQKIAVDVLTPVKQVLEDSTEVIIGYEINETHASLFSDANKMYYVETDIPLKVTYKAAINLISDGNIEIVSLGAAPTSGVDAVIYSTEGNITVKELVASKMNGLLYAPKGTVTFEDLKIGFNGAIIAQNCIISKISSTITYDEAWPNKFEESRLKLVK